MYSKREIHNYGRMSAHQPSLGGESPANAGLGGDVAGAEEGGGGGEAREVEPDLGGGAARVGGRAGRGHLARPGKAIILFPPVISYCAKRISFRDLHSVGHESVPTEWQEVVT